MGYFFFQNHFGSFEHRGIFGIHKDDPLHILLGFRLNDFRDGIRELAAHWKVEDILVERGLFAFSENFFSNDSLTLRGLVEDQTDLAVAKSLAA